MAEERKFLTFKVNNETFGIPIEQVREITSYENIRKLPLMPDWFHGLVNLRGSGIPVVDLSVKFSGKLCPLNKLTCIVILQLETSGEMHSTGLLVDSVEEVLGVASEMVEKITGINLQISEKFISGIIKKGDQFIPSLNIPEILSEDADLIRKAASGELQK